MQDSVTPVVGAQVLTRDGEILGEVKEIKGDRFKVDAPLRRDYWLDDSEIDRVEQGAVCLTFLKDDLDEHRRDEPAT